jgi:hypothetical protein
MPFYIIFLYILVIDVEEGMCLFLKNLMEKEGFLVKLRNPPVCRW